MCVLYVIIYYSELSANIYNAIMDKIASNFKIGSQAFREPEKNASSNGVPPSNMVFLAIAIVLLFVAYLNKDALLKLYKTVSSQGLTDTIWSTLYLTSNGEVATTYVPDTSITNSITEILESTT